MDIGMSKHFTFHFSATVIVFADAWARRPSTVELLTTLYMMTSLNGNIFRVTGPLSGEFTGHQCIPHTKASDAELWCYLWSAPWINGWINNREAGDLRRHRAHYDVTVMVGGAFRGVFRTRFCTSHKKYKKRRLGDGIYFTSCLWYIIHKHLLMISVCTPMFQSTNKIYHNIFILSEIKYISEYSPIYTYLG